MNDIEKFDLVIEALIEARRTQKDYLIKMELTTGQPLSFVGRNKVLNFLEEIQGYGNTITLLQCNYPPKEFNKQIIGTYDIDPETKIKKYKKLETPIKIKTQYPDPNSITLSLLPGFENWHQTYLIKKNHSSSTLSQLNLEKIYALILDIDDKLQVNPSPNVEVGLRSNYTWKFNELNYSIMADIGRRQKEYRIDALNYLKTINAINTYTINRDVNIKLNIVEFNKIKIEITKVYTERSIPNSISSPEFPPNTGWEDIAMKFIDGNNIEITAKDYKCTAHFKEMGFEDKRTLRPNMQWDLLQYLAEHTGQISWDSAQANEKIKKKKQRLSETLKKYFKISEEPFFNYKSEEAYTIKIRFHS